MEWYWWVLIGVVALYALYRGFVWVVTDMWKY